MKSLLSTKVSLICLYLLLTLTASEVFAGGNKYYGNSSGNSVGIRLGWSGGANGLSYKIGMGRGFSGLELTAGYSPKEGRAIEMPNLKKGNYMFSARLQPTAMMGDCNFAVGFYGSFGLGARIHNYRPIIGGSRGSWITPDLLGGGGMLVNLGGVEIFADMNLKYYNRITNQYQMSYESGLGLRVLI